MIFDFKSDGVDAIGNVAAIDAVESAHRQADEPLLDRLEALMHGMLEWLHTRPAPGGQRPFVPDEYRDSDLPAAPDRSAWRSAHCRQDAPGTPDGQDR